MPRTNYQRGADKERAILNRARKEGCIALRSAGSHSLIDVVIINPKIKRILLIQSKLGKTSNHALGSLLDDGRRLNGTYEIEFKVIQRGELS